MDTTYNSILGIQHEFLHTIVNHNFFLFFFHFNSVGVAKKTTAKGVTLEKSVCVKIGIHRVDMYLRD